MPRSAQSPRVSRLRLPHITGKSFLELVPVLALFHVLIGVEIPKLIGLQLIPGSRPENIIFWVVAGGATILLWIKHRRQSDSRLWKQPAFRALACYFIFSAASTFWAYDQGETIKAFVLHVLVAACILLPFSLPIETDRIIQRIAIGCMVTLLINAIVVLTTPTTPLGHYGAYAHKQQFGGVIALCMLFFIGEIVRGGVLRRLASAIFFAMAIWLILESKSKSALLFVFLAPIFALFILVVCRLSKIAPAIFLSLIPISFTIGGIDTRQFLSRQSFRFYGDGTITNRTDIWQFMDFQISKHPWFGWGFHSYWGVPNTPHLEASGFVRDMISSHSGYMDLMVDTGRIGYLIFMIFVYTSLSGVGIIARKDFRYAWVLLSLSLYVILLNLIESVWMNLLAPWLVFLVVTAEAHRFLLLREDKLATSGAGVKARIAPRPYPAAS